MVKIFRKCVKAYKSYVLYIRCKRAIKRADRNAVVTGKKQVKSLKIKPEIVDPEDIEMLEDTV